MSTSNTAALAPYEAEALSADEKHEFAREVAIVGRLWRARMTERLKAFDMTMPSWAALYWLWQADGGLSQTALAERAAVEPGTLVRTIDLLEKQGLVERRACAHDRRVNLLHLTEAAYPLIARIDADADQVRSAAMARLDPDDVRAALALLRSLHSRLV